MSDLKDEGLRESIGEERAGGRSDLGYRAVAAIVFVAVLVPAVYFVGWLGATSAYQFLVVGGDPAEGTKLGLAFAALVGLFSVGAGILSLLPLRSGRYALPGWVAHFLVVVLGLYSFVLLFLFALGGLGGPPADVSAGREFLHALYGWFPQIPIIGVVAATEGAVIWRTVRSVHRVSVRRLPVVLGGLVTAIVLALVVMATVITA